MVSYVIFNVINCLMKKVEEFQCDFSQIIMSTLILTHNLTIYLLNISSKLSRHMCNFEYIIVSLTVNLR